jgi:hypothetical protein
MVFGARVERMKRAAAWGMTICMLMLPAAQGLGQSTGERIEVYGEYPAVEELGEDAFVSRDPQLGSPLIDYGRGANVRERAMVEALHFLNANVYGYTFQYKPGSRMMETEEVFNLELKGTLEERYVQIVAEGVNESVYRVKIALPLTPSMRSWTTAFTSNRLRLQEAEGNSDFFTGWEGRSDAYQDALRNLVLATARKKLSSRPLLMTGDILIRENPVFSVGAGRHLCTIQGYVNIVNVVTYD